MTLGWGSLVDSKRMESSTAGRRSSLAGNKLICSSRENQRGSTVSSASSIPLMAHSSRADTYSGLGWIKFNGGQ